MSYFLTKKKWLTSEAMLLFVVILITTIRLAGLFYDNEIPGWDGSSNLFTASKMAFEFLPQGHVSGYLPEWLGGISLFQFYPPLFPLIVSIFWYLTHFLFSFPLVFRLTTYLVLIGFILSFWYCLRTLFGSSVAKWGIPLSLVFVFYPLYTSVIGIGAGGTIWVGLAPSTLGINLVLLLIAAIHKLKNNPSSLFLVALITLLLAALTLTHILSLAMGLVVVLLSLILYGREKKFRNKIVIAFLASLGLTAFWTIPFLENFSLTAAESNGIALIRDPLLALFPFNPRMLLSFSTFPAFKFWAFSLLLLSIYGGYRLIRHKHYFLPILFAIFFVFIIRDYLIILFPEFGIYYYRFIPFLLVITLAISAYALHGLYESISLPRTRIIFLILGLVLLLQSQISFTTGTNDFNPSVRDLVFYSNSLKWQWEDYSGFPEANAVVTALGELPDVRRVYVELPPDEGVVDYGSLHYFTSQIPLRNHQAVITGLYVESSPLTPFIMPTLDALTNEESVIVWGDARLKGVKTFYKQPFETQLERLGQLGVNYIVSYNRYLTSQLNLQKNVEFIGRTQHFFVFKIKNTLPLVFPTAKPGVFIHETKSLTFRDLATAIFAGRNTHYFPVVNSNLKIQDLNEKSLDPFSIIIINAEGLTKRDLIQVKNLDHPTVVLNPDPTIPLELPADTNFRYIPQFEVIPKGFPTVYEYGPASWAMFLSALEKFGISTSSPKTVVSSTFSSQKITFDFNGPVMINAGYTPDWQNTSCTNCPVYEVSPAMMLVFANGSTTLEYKPTGEKSVAELVSWFSFIIFVGVIGNIMWRERKIRT